MIAPQKRSAEPADNENSQVKKPKFVKKNGSKGKFDNKKPKGNPFKGDPRKLPKSAGKNDFSKDKNESATLTEKKDWNKFKKEKKELRKTRKVTKTNVDKIHEAKQIYEKLKCKSTPNKDELCKELHKMFRNGETYQKLVMAHDTARMVQCLLKHSPANICQEISESLIPVVGKLAVCDYAHFCIPRLLKYGPNEIKKNVIEALFGNIISMLSRPKSTTIIDSVYISYANSNHKALMRQELYGDLYKTSKDKEVKCIRDTFKDSPHMKLAILNSVKSNLEHIANKKLVDNSLVHAVLLDFLNLSNNEDRAEIIALYSPHIAALVSTKDGVRAAMICFWQSIVKDRRAILKSIREHLTKTSTHEHGHVFILAIANSYDDTKALKKSIFDPIFAEIETIAANEWGRKVIEWFVAPADTTCYHPQTISLLEEGLKFSKKDKEVRRAELLEAVHESLCKAISENPHFWLRGGHTAITTVAICKAIPIEKGSHYLKSALDSLAQLVVDGKWTVPLKEISEEENTEAKNIKKKLEATNNVEQKMEEDKVQMVAGVEHAGLHISLKKLLKLTQFPSSLSEKLTSDVVENWLQLNRPSFLLLNAFENGDEEVQTRIKKLIGNYITLLKAQKHAASKLLITKLGL